MVLTTPTYKKKLTVQKPREAKAKLKGPSCYRKKKNGPNSSASKLLFDIRQFRLSTTKNCNQKSWSPLRDLNLKPTAHEAEVVSIRHRSQVKTWNDPHSNQAEISLHYLRPIFKHYISILQNRYIAFKELTGIWWKGFHSHSEANIQKTWKEHHFAKVGSRITLHSLARVGSVT